MDFTVEQQEKIEEIKRAVYKSAVEKTELKVFEKLGITKEEVSNIDLKTVISENNTLKTQIEELNNTKTELEGNIATLSEQNEQYNNELAEFLEVKNTQALTDKFKDVFDDTNLEKALKIAKSMYGITADLEEDKFNESIDTMKGDFPEYFKAKDTKEPTTDGIKTEIKPIGGVFNL